jgi:hypothetical protein
MVPILTLSGDSPHPSSRDCIIFSELNNTLTNKKNEINTIHVNPLEIGWIYAIDIHKFIGYG